MFPVTIFGHRFQSFSVFDVVNPRSARVRLHYVRNISSRHSLSSLSKYQAISLQVTPRLHRSVSHCVSNIALRHSSPLSVCHALVSPTTTAPEFDGNVFTLGARAVANRVYIRAFRTHLPAKMATSTISDRFATSGGIDYVYSFINV